MKGKNSVAIEPVSVLPFRTQEEERRFHWEAIVQGRSVHVQPIGSRFLLSPCSLILEPAGSSMELLTRPVFLPVIAGLVVIRHSADRVSCFTPLEGQFSPTAF